MVKSLIFTKKNPGFTRYSSTTFFLDIFPSAHRWIGPENMGCVKMSYFDPVPKIEVPDIANLRNFCRFSRFRWRLCAWALRLRRATAWSPSSAAVAIAGSGGGKGHGKKRWGKTVGKNGQLWKTGGTLYRKAWNNCETTLENYGKTWGTLGNVWV